MYRWRFFNVAFSFRDSYVMFRSITIEPLGRFSLHCRTCQNHMIDCSRSFFLRSDESVIQERRGWDEPNPVSSKSPLVRPVSGEKHTTSCLDWLKPDGQWYFKNSSLHCNSLCVSLWLLCYLLCTDWYFDWLLFSCSLAAPSPTTWPSPASTTPLYYTTMNQASTKSIHRLLALCTTCNCDPRLGSDSTEFLQNASYLTFIHRRLSEYCRIIDNIHLAWGE